MVTSGLSSISESAIVCQITPHNISLQSLTDLYTDNFQSIETDSSFFSKLEVRPTVQKYIDTIQKSAFGGSSPSIGKELSDIDEEAHHPDPFGPSVRWQCPLPWQRSHVMFLAGLQLPYCPPSCHTTLKEAAGRFTNGGW